MCTYYPWIIDVEENGNMTNVLYDYPTTNIFGEATGRGCATCIQNQQPITGEKKMNKDCKVNPNTIIDLATHIDDDLTKHIGEVGNSDINAALKEAASKRRAEKIASAADDILDLLDVCQGTKDVIVKGIRKRRSEIKDGLETLDKIDKLLEYGSETTNYIPLLIITGTISDSDTIDVGKQMADSDEWIRDYDSTHKKSPTPKQKVSPSEEDIKPSHEDIPSETSVEPPPDKEGHVVKKRRQKKF